MLAQLQKKLQDSQVLLNVSNTTNVNLIMISDQTQLDEVVVIGYGTVLKKDVTGALTSVKVKDNVNHQAIIDLNDANKKLIKRYPPDLIYIYSTRSAQSFVAIVKNYSLGPLMTQSTVMCISEKVAKIFRSQGWKKIEIFNPGDEMLKLQDLN